MRIIFNTKLNKSKTLFFILFITTFILSNSLFIILGTSSLNSGLIFSLVFFLLIGIISGKINFLIDRYFFLIIHLLIILLFIQLGISILIYSNIELSRSVLSIALLYIILIAGVRLFYFINEIKEEHFHSVIKSSYNIMFFIFFVSIFLQRKLIILDRSMILFKEPSHFMLVYMPLLLYYIYFNTHKKRVAILIINMIGFFLIQNLIAFVGLGIILVTLFWRNNKILLIIPLIVTLLLILPNIEQFSYYIDRLSISRYSNNLSALVWISGWERAFISLFQSYGFGVGFQRMGFVGDKGIAMQTIYELLNNNYINLYDGGSLAPKIIAEIGLTGVVIVFIFLKYLFRILNFLISRKEKRKIDVFFSSVFIMFSVQMFFRGVGYFAPTTLFFISSVYWITKEIS